GQTGSGRPEKSVAPASQGDELGCAVSVEFDMPVLHDQEGANHYAIRINTRSASGTFQRIFHLAGCAEGEYADGSGARTSTQCRHLIDRVHAMSIEGTRISKARAELPHCRRTLLSWRTFLQQARFAALGLFLGGGFAMVCPAQCTRDIYALD